MKKYVIKTYKESSPQKVYIYISVATHEQVSYPNPNDELCGHSHH